MKALLCYYPVHNFNGCFKDSDIPALGTGYCVYTVVYKCGKKHNVTDLGKYRYEKGTIRTKKKKQSFKHAHFSPKGASWPSIGQIGNLS